MPLMEPDEARYADIPSLMNRTGDYITPHLNHLVYLEKPPLGYWATALSFKIFGENEFSSRLFVALCAWGCILLVYRIGTYFHDEKTGLYSAGVLATFLYHSILGKVNTLDMPVTLFVCVATWAGYRYLAEDFQKKRWLYLLYVSSALGFLTKGLIGVVFPFAILVLWLFISRRWRDAPKLFSLVGIIFFLLISCPWIILVQKANPDFLWFFFIQEHFLRYTTEISHRSHGILFYVPIIIFGTLPWSAFLLKAWEGVRQKNVSLFEPSEKRFLLIWAFFILIFFSISRSKLTPYVAPAFIPTAVFFGHLFRSYEGRDVSLGEGKGRSLLYHLPIFFQSLAFVVVLLSPIFIKNVTLGQHLGNFDVEHWWLLILLPVLFQVMLLFLPDQVKRRWRGSWFLTIATLSALFLISAHFPLAHVLSPWRSASSVSKAIRELLPPNQKLYQFNMSLYGIDFYNKMSTVLVGAVGELEFGLIHLPPGEFSKYYLSPQEFLKRCKENGVVYCVTRHKRNLEILKSRVSVVEVLWGNGEFYLLRLRS